ncbi:VWA domain-containing protein [Occallatibacter savannae]|uniref:VWA domain-containing protein n=1 Tax=Occallatibacter savannae TaxID=1002691 RepID=UPI000D69340B|nr:VWA domain-containing protein [Occallatibacter savannae]
MRKLGSLCFILFSSVFAVSHAQPSSPATADSRQQKPIFVDVVVTDATHKPVADLEPFDFSVLDENHPQKLMGFRRTDGKAGSKIDPPVEVIVVLDAVNLPYQWVTRLRLELAKFLRADGGRLAQPTSIYLFGSDGLHVQPAPSRDGNALAALVDQAGPMRARDITGGVYALEEQYKDSYKAITGIAENLSHRPGRKVLIWMGPGWPLLSERFFIQTNVSRNTYYHQLAVLQNKLREARATIYCVYGTAGVTNTLYEKFLDPVREIKKMEIGNMGLQVFALHTGGRVLGPSNDVKGLLDDCVAEIGEYYTLALVPPPATKADEYHDLKVQVNRPGVTVKTETGYYNEPID